MLNLMSLFLFVWLMKFSPSHRILYTLQLTVQYSCQFKILLLNFKYLLILIKILVVHIKYNCTQDYKHFKFRFLSIFIYLLQKSHIFFIK